MTKNLNVAKLYATVRVAELYDAEYHLKNSYLKNLLKTHEDVEKYKEQLEHLKKHDNHTLDAYITLRYIFNEFGYIDKYTMKKCLNSVNRFIKNKKRYNKVK
jgi:hypothetical protein